MFSATLYSQMTPEIKSSSPCSIHPPQSPSKPRGRRADSHRSCQDDAKGVSSFRLSSYTFSGKLDSTLFTDEGAKAMRNQVIFQS